jgi:hypothetical protein
MTVSQNDTKPLHVIKLWQEHCEDTVGTVILYDLVHLLPGRECEKSKQTIIVCHGRLS